MIISRDSETAPGVTPPTRITRLELAYNAQKPTKVLFQGPAR